MSPLPRDKHAGRSGSSAGKKGEPAAAVLLTLFVPGLGHLYLGKITLGLLAFALVEGLYLAGYLLSDGLVFSYLDPELRGRMAVMLSPEAGNLGALVWHFSSVGFGPEQPVPWPSWIRLGGALCSFSGILNACLMVHVHLCARRESELERAAARGGSLSRPARQVLSASAFPGLGHLAQGRTKRALIVAGVLVGLFLFGCVLCDWTNLSRERHFYYWAGQFMLGLPAVASELMGLDQPVTAAITYVDAGLLFGCVAGLLNVLAMLDVYAYAEDELRGVTRAGKQPAAEPTSAVQPVAAAGVGAATTGDESEGA